ncbi:UNVERIFIED_CONTAM: Anapc1 [Trichonephila clavipes]
MRVCPLLKYLKKGDFLRQYKYLDHYCQDFPEQFKSVNKHFIIPDGDIQKVLYPSYFAAPPSIYHYINTCLTSSFAEPFPYIPNVTRMLHGIVLVFAVLTSLENPVFRIKDYLSEVIGLGFTIKDINSLPIGLALPIKDALLNCWHEPSGLWSKDMFDLIGICRRDLSSLQSPEKLKVLPQPTKSKHEHGKNSSKDNFEDGLHHLDLEVLRLRFDQDHRVHDVFQMLQSSKPVQISLVQRPEVSDHEFIEEQERHLYNLCIRTMAATVGRGMFTLRAYNPVVTEALPIPKLCLTGRAPPRNTTVDLSHIDVPPNMNMWPLFHNGVAAGLSISLNASKIDSTWMVYNKPRSSSSDTPTEHAGFLMALGLNGHLSRLSTLSIHDYLCKGHELTSVGILLGVSAAKVGMKYEGMLLMGSHCLPFFRRGTMDLSATKLLSIHIEALLPPTSTELDVAPAVQVAAVMGLGLLYQGSGHHHMAEVLLGEIGRPPGPEMEHSIDRESYSLAAGLALGLITLGKGKEMSGVADFPMADQLYHYMVGGHKRPLTGIHKEKHKSPSYQIREGDNVNVDVTSPGATLALGMMFFDTDNQ